MGFPLCHRYQGQENDRLPNPAPASLQPAYWFPSKTTLFCLVGFGVHKSLSRVHPPSTKAMVHPRSNQRPCRAEVRATDLTSLLGNPCSGWFSLVRNKCQLGEETRILKGFYPPPVTRPHESCPQEVGVGVLRETGLGLTES